MFDFLEVALETSAWAMLFIMSLCGLFFLYMVITAVYEELKFKKSKEQLYKSLDKEEQK